MVLLLVIHSGTCVCRYLFISGDSLSWMEVDFLDQKPCIPSWPGVFQFDIFLNVALSKSVCISAFVPSSSSSISLYSFRLFVMFFCLPYFSPKSLGFFLHPVDSMFYCHLLPIVDRIFFHRFAMSYFFCIVLPFVDISLIFLFHLYFLIYFLKFLLFCLLFSVPNNSSVFLLFYHFVAIFVDFLSEFLVEIPILVLTFLSWFLRGSQFSRKLISLLHKLVHLIRLYYSLMSVLDSLYLSLP